MRVIREQFRYLGVLVAASLFFGLLIATAGTAFYPPLFRIATPFLCSGEVELDSQTFSYKPGSRVITREVYCVSPDKSSREDVTLKAIFLGVFLYAAIVFPILAFVIVPLLPRRLRVSIDGSRFRDAAPPGPAGGLENIVYVVEQAAAAAKAGEKSRGDIAASLAELKKLHDAGLITDADYEAKKAEILSRL